MVYIHLAKGFEEIEALTAADLLRRVGVDAVLVSVTDQLTVEGAHGIRVQADCLFEDADYEQCSMIVLPGGMPGTLGLRDHQGLREKILEFDRKGKKIAAICAAPLVLGTLDIYRGRKATIYEGMEEHLAGAAVTHMNVVCDENLITSKGPGTAMEFALALVESIRGSETAEELRKDLLLK